MELVTSVINFGYGYGKKASCLCCKFIFAVLYENDRENLTVFCPESEADEKENR